jgi:hypothetical protein
MNRIMHIACVFLAVFLLGACTQELATSPQFEDHPSQVLPSIMPAPSTTLDPDAPPSVQGTEEPMIEMPTLQAVDTQAPPVTPYAPEAGVWIDTPIGENADHRFSLEFDPAEWELVEGELHAQLIHTSLANCDISKTAGMGLGPGWSALNRMVMIGELEFMRTDLLLDGVLQFDTMYGGDPWVGFRIGQSNISQACIDRAEVVLATLIVTAP